MKPSTYKLVLAGIALVAGCAGSHDVNDTEDAPENTTTAETWLGDVKVSLSVPSARVRETEPVLLTVTLSNESAQEARVSRQSALSSGLRSPLLDVRRDGAPVQYLGIIARALASNPDAYLSLKAGESVSHTVDLATAYDLSNTGEYTIAYPGEPEAATVRLHAEGRRFASPEPEGRAELDADPDSEIGSTSQAVLRNCNTEQTDEVRKAWGSARDMVADANAFFSLPMKAAPRYTTWFGTVATYRWDLIKGRFQGMAPLFDVRDVDCNNDATCRSDPTTIAYVRTNQPYLIHVCAPFWGMPRSGADSKADTFVHELSHFFGTGDAVYGQPGCRNLAAADPIGARGNADNYAYFAANPGNLGY